MNRRMPTPITSVLQSIQVDAANRLLADPYFEDVTVLTENLHDIENQIEIAIKKLGIVAILVTPTADVRQMQDAPGPYFEEINVVVQVSENVLLNRSVNGTGKTALDVCEHALAILHGYHPTTISEALYASNPTIALVADPNGLLTYHVSFRTHGGLHYDISKIDAPVITNAGQQVSITSATPNAQIFYTTDGHTTNPKNGTFYTGPFSAAYGTTVKARAYLAGYLDSAQTTKVITQNSIVPVVTSALMTFIEGDGPPTANPSALTSPSIAYDTSGKFWVWDVLLQQWIGCIE